MAINIKNPEVEQAVRRLASRLGVDMTKAIAEAVNHELTRTSQGSTSRLSTMRTISSRIAALPLLDSRSEAELLGYDEAGLPQ